MKQLSSDFSESLSRYEARLCFPDGTNYPGEILKLNLTAALNGSTTELQLGAAPAATLTGTVEAASRSLENQVVTLWMGRMVGGVPEEVPMGRFTITSAVKNGGTVDITGYDAMATAMETPYIPTEEPASAKAALADICQQAGVPLLLEGSLEDVPLYDAIGRDFTRREAAAYMAMLLGGNACLDGQGCFRVKWYTDSGVIVDNDNLYSDGHTVSQETLTLNRIDCAVPQVRIEVGEDGTESMTEETDILSVGEGSVCLSLRNPWMNLDTLSGIWNRIGGGQWHSGSLTILGDLRLEPGDCVHLVDEAGTDRLFPIMEIAHSYDGGLKTTITAYGKSAADAGVNTAGALTQSVERMSARMAVFEHLTADNFSAAKADIQNLSALKADLDLANIQEGCITNAMIGSLSADKIRGGTIDAAEITVKNLDAGSITVGTINGKRIGSGAIDVEHLADAAVTTDKIATQAITADKIDVTDLFAQDIRATGSITGVNLRGADLSFYLSSELDDEDPEQAGHIWFDNGLRIESAAGTALYLDASRGIDMGQGRVYVENLSVKDQNVPVIRTGTTATLTVPASSYLEQSIIFGYTYDSAPSVFLTLKTGSTNAKMGLLQAAVSSISKTGCTVRLYNNHTSSFQPSVQWMAVG